MNKYINKEKLLKYLKTKLRKSKEWDYCRTNNKLFWKRAK